MKNKIICFGNHLALSGSYEVFDLIAKALPDYSVDFLFHHAVLNANNQPKTSHFNKINYIPSQSVDFIEKTTKLINSYDLCIHSLIPMQFRGVIKSKLTIPQVEVYHSVAGWNLIKQDYSKNLLNNTEIWPNKIVSISNGLRNIINGDINTWNKSNKPEVKTIYNGVHVPNQILSMPSDKTISYIGRISHDKGIDHVMDLFCKIYKSRKEKIKFRIIGGVTFSESEYLYKVIQNLSRVLFDNNLVFVPMVSAKVTLYAYMKDTTILVNASPAEGLPIVLVEGMANGCTALTLKSTLGDTAESGCEMFDSDEDLVNYAVNYTDTLNNRENNRCKVRDKFSEVVFANEWNKLIKELIK
jgi:glycosyltransferase involved in cell wall biosynthesis